MSYTKYIKDLYESLDDESEWVEVLPFLRGLIDDVLQRLTECDSPQLPVKVWLGVTLKHIDADNLPGVLRALQSGCRAAYGDVRERVGEVTHIGSGPFARKIYDDKEARCLSSLGALAYRLGTVLKE